MVSALKTRVRGNKGRLIGKGRKMRIVDSVDNYVDNFFKHEKMIHIKLL